MADETTKVKRSYNKSSTQEKDNEKTFSEDEVKKLIAEAVANAMKNIQQPQIIVKESKDQEVTLLYMGCVAEGAKVYLGDNFGYIQGRGGMLTINKRLFLQNMNENVLRRLKDRRLVVIDGLDESERERYDLNYSDGELVSQDIYYKLFSLSEDNVAKIFKMACYRHKQLIATLYYDEYISGGNRVNQQFIQRLNELSKEVEKEGMFKAMLKDMALDLQEEADRE